MLGFAEEVNMNPGAKLLMKSIMSEFAAIYPPIWPKAFDKVPLMISISSETLNSAAIPLPSGP